MGKTQSGAVWLDPNKTTPFEFYQYWRNVADADVLKCLRMLTFLPLEQIDEMDIAGLEIRGVRDAEGDYGLLAYLNEHQKPTLEQLRALVDAAEAQIIVLEDAFQGDDQLKTNLAQLCKAKGIELWTA